MAFIDYKIVLPHEVSTTNPNVGDLFLENGNLIPITDDTDDDKLRAAMQGIYSRLLLFKGEYFLSLKEGVPWFQNILIKKPSLPLIRSIVSQTILSYPSVILVETLNLDWDRSNRTLDISFVAKLDNNLTLRSQDFGPLFIDISSFNTKGDNYNR
jgi:hypothetical protein